MVTNLKTRAERVQKRFLAYLFADKRFIAASVGRIKPDHLPDYRFIYQLLIEYYQRYKDVITDEIVDIMFGKGNVGADDVIRYKGLIGELRGLMVKDGRFTGNDAEFNALAEELEEIQRRRDYVAIAETIVDVNPLDCPTERLERLEQDVRRRVTAITAKDGVVRREGDIRESARVRWEAYKRIKENPEEINAIPTGFSKIDEQSGGFRRGELIYVIGRKGDGKSITLLNFAYHAWIHGHNVIIFTLEIGKDDYERRFDARAANVPSNGLKMGRLTPEDERSYLRYLKNLERGKVEVVDRETGQTRLVNCGTFYTVDCPKGCTPAFVESKLDTIEQVMGIKGDVVIVDYAGIMIPNVHVPEKRHQQGQIALDLKRIARERDVVVISAAQMTREGGRSQDVDSTHVAESDQIVDHLDWGIAVKSISDTTGVMSSIKTRDDAPFKFHFTKKYSHMKMIELEDSLGQWDNLTGLD